MTSASLQAVRWAGRYLLLDQSAPPLPLPHRVLTPARGPAATETVYPRRNSVTLRLTVRTVRMRQRKFTITTASTTILPYWN